MKRVGSTGVQGFVAALLIHLAGFSGLFLVSPAKSTKTSIRPSVKIRVINRPKLTEKPVEIPKSQPEVNEPIIVKPKRPLGKKSAYVKTPPIVKPSKKATAFQSKPVTKKPRKFTVSMEATIPSGAVSVPTSSDEGWTFGAPDGEPKGEKILAKPSSTIVEKKSQPVYKDVAGVTLLPKLISQPSSRDMRAAYPDSERRNGVEANVYLKILINAQGRVARVRVLRGAGKEFDQAAKQLVLKFRFRPAEIDGQPVGVWIPWTYKFRLE